MKTAVITGTTSGIGKAIAQELSRDYRVIEVARRATPSHDLYSLSTPDFLRELDSIDVLIHAAARCDRRSVETASQQDWEDTFNLNVLAPALLTRDLLPALRRANATVIFINSGARKGPHPHNAVYAASKHALLGIADALREEESDIRVSTVSPGPTDTPMLRHSFEEMGQPYHAEDYIQPEEIARAVRAVIDAGPTTQLSNIDVRPRRELK